MKGYMKEVAHMLGVELKEEFEVDYGKGRVATAKLKPSGLEVINTNFDFYGDINRLLLECLLNGSCTIKRKQRMPSYGERYYYVAPYGVMGTTKWASHASDMVLYKLGNCYSTMEEANENRDKWKAFYASTDILEV